MEGATLGNAVGIVMQSALRHLMTEHETLLLHGAERETARRQVQPKIQARLAVWRRRPEPAQDAPPTRPPHQAAPDTVKSGLSRPPTALQTW
ncbi:DUF2293 domain-containing protein [Ensifer sp. ENS04]|nr:DUF2293 domain-containing protein [Ensifer sp. ENS04]